MQLRDFGLRIAEAGPNSELGARNLMANRHEGIAVLAGLGSPLGQAEAWTTNGEADGSAVPQSGTSRVLGFQPGGAKYLPDLRRITRLRGKAERRVGTHGPHKQPGGFGFPGCNDG
jgi:hypothetical protein